MRTDQQEIERDGLGIQGDFSLQLTLAANRRDSGGITVLLAGEEGGADLSVDVFKTNS